MAKQFEHLIVHDNLYLVSEAVKISLIEVMPYLIECNLKKQIVSVLVTKELANILHDMICFYENWVSEKAEDVPTHEEVDLEIEQVFLHLDGTFKYCPRIISPLLNYEMSSTNQPSPGHKFQEQAIKKIQVFMDDIEFLLDLLLSKIETTDSTQDDGGIGRLMHKIKNYFRTMRHKKLGSTQEQFFQYKHFTKKVLQSL